mmetsp:Transcript_18453/g.45721  ORF Transcript_18453/g.45721 Transcript_18453/m.45721 type:complete len:212 (+) Transcript_18453:3313-3948(+)
MAKAASLLPPFSSSSSMASSLSSPSSSSSPVEAFSGSVNLKKMGRILSICGCCNRLPTALDTVHMVRINARVFSLLLEPLSSICPKRRSTALTNRASLRTTLRHPRAFPARFRTTTEASLEVKRLRQICRTGSCWRVTLIDEAPNLPRRSVRTSRQERTISSLVFARVSSSAGGDEEQARMPSKSRPINRSLVRSPMCEGIVLTSVRIPIA